MPCSLQACKTPINKGRSLEWVKTDSSSSKAFLLPITAFRSSSMHGLLDDYSGFLGHWDSSPLPPAALSDPHIQAPSGICRTPCNMVLLLFQSGRRKLGFRTWGNVPKLTQLGVDFTTSLNPLNFAKSQIPNKGGNTSETAFSRHFVNHSNALNVCQSSFLY